MLQLQEYTWLIDTIRKVRKISLEEYLAVICISENP